MPRALKRPGLLLLPVLFVVIPSLLFALPVPPAPIPEGLDAPGPRAPEYQARLSARSGELLRNLEAGLDGNRDAETDTLDVLALLVEFSDVKMPDSLANLSDGVMIYRTDWFQDQFERVNDYYRTISGERLFIKYSVPDTLFTLPQAMGVYGDDALDWTQAVHWLAVDAVQLADSTIDFSEFDLTVFLHAGSGQESDLNRDSLDQIWSGYVDFESITEAFADSMPDYEGIVTGDQDSTYTLQRFAIAPEKEVEESLDPPYVLGALGVMVHQMGGYLGLVGLNDYVEPRGQGAGNFDLMSSGLWNALGFVPGPPSGFNRMLMGWADVVEYSKEDADRGLSLTLPSMSEVHRLPISDREYFLIENRDQDADGDSLFTFGDSNGNYIPDYGESMLNAEWDYFTTQANAEDHVPGSGLFIWRIDEELLHLSFLLGSNVINAWNDHYGVCLLEADGFADLSYSPGYHTEAYGSDYDAFRAAGGPNDLIATQTGMDASGYPNTLSAEGAVTGWTFRDVSAHGQEMSYVVEWDSVPGWLVERLELPPYRPIGDPLALREADDYSLIFAAWEESGLTLLMSVEVGGGTFDVIADLAALAVGSPAAGDIDGDGDVELVLLDENGGIHAWHRNGEPLGGSSLLVQLEGAFTRRPMLHDVDEDGDLDILVLQIDPEGGTTRPRFIDETGADTGPGWAEIAGLPASDPVLLLSVEASQRGYDHPVPDRPSIAFGLVDSILRIQGLPLGPEESIWALTRDCPCLNTQLAAGDMDGDGSDELLMLRSGQVEVFHPMGRFDGYQAGEFEITPDGVYAFADIASLGGSLLPMDADGNGSLEMLGLYPASAGLWSADGDLWSDWPKTLPSNAPLVWTDDPAVWALTLRRSDGRDDPAIFTRDGRFLPEGPEGEAVLLGGSLPAQPTVLNRNSDQLTVGNRFMGLTFFEVLESSTAEEDTLISTPRLSAWWMDTPYSNALPAWAMAGGDPARTGRLAAASAVDVSGAGSGNFVEAYPYPNPAGSSVTWRVLCDSPDRVEIEIYDLEGQRLWSDELALDGFSPAERELPLDDYAPGLYFFRIHSATSGRLETGRLAVIR